MYKRKGESKMKKSNLVKVVSILIISVMVMIFSTNVFAADNTNGFTQLTLDGSNTAANNTNTNNTNTNNTNTNSNKVNNTSIYNNTNLPKTGVASSIPVAMLVVVFGISAVYAYKKIKDYRNI